MAEALWWIMTIVGPLLLLIALVWLVFLRPSNRTTARTEHATHEEYADEEKRRREGTDGL